MALWGGRKAEGESRSLRTSTSREPPGIAIVGVVEFWSKQLPNPSLIESLRQLRPRPFVRPDDSRHWLCRFRVSPETHSKLTPQRRIAAWCRKNSATIKAARKMQIEVVASVEVYGKLPMYTIPIDLESAKVLQRDGIAFQVVHHSAA